MPTFCLFHQTRNNNNKLYSYTIEQMLTSQNQEFDRRKQTNTHTQHTLKQADITNTSTSGNTETQSNIYIFYLYIYIYIY